jgi:hypothetical protein
MDVLTIFCFERYVRDLETVSSRIFPGRSSSRSTVPVTTGGIGVANAASADDHVEVANAASADDDVEDADPAPVPDDDVDVADPLPCAQERRGQEICVSTASNIGGTCFHL